jgi:serine/threonine protein kinase
MRGGEMGTAPSAVRRVVEDSTDKYRIIAELGEGGMANVYLAVARGPGGFNKLLVLKAIREALAREPETLAMFLDEARLSARLSHPNVVQTMEVMELRGRPVMVMEYLDGQPLSDIRHGREGREITQAMRLRVLSAALEGLQYIHDLTDFDGTPLNLVHRDVSPHNIFVTFDGQVKLLDFGIAKGLISRAQTSTDVIKGKIRYMAPEQMAGEAVDRRADVFSAGVVLWEIAADRRIWHGRHDAVAMNAVLNEGVPPPRSVEPSVPPELNAICMRALARSPGDRYATAAELQAAVDGFLEVTGSKVTTKDVGKALAKVFAEKRAQTKEIIEAELKKSEEQPLTSSGRFALPSTLVSLATSSPTGSVDVAPPKAPRRRWLAVGAATALVAVAAAAVLLPSSRSRSPAAKAEPTANPSSASEAEPAAPSASTAAGAVTERTVRLQVKTTPQDVPAALFLDEKRLDANPYSGTYAPDGERHVVRAEATGYAPASATVTLDNDVSLLLSLTKSSGRVVDRPPRTTTAAAPAPASATPTVPANRNCNPPFYFDAQGIKRLKVECL